MRRRRRMERGPDVGGLTSQERSLFMMLLVQAEVALDGVFTV
jgi:hypothetical protein